MIKGFLFDLDGVIVDTAKYHFLTWKRLADELSITFTENDNERLKGVSRMRSLDIILELGSLELTEQVKKELAADFSCFTGHSQPDDGVRTFFGRAQHTACDFTKQW